MTALTGKLGATLLKATHARDVDDAISKIIPEYVELKLERLARTIASFEQKYGMDWAKFRLHCKSAPSTFSFEVERDFWEWEEAETLKQHYSELAGQ